MLTDHPGWRQTYRTSASASPPSSNKLSQRPKSISPLLRPRWLSVSRFSVRWPPNLSSAVCQLIRDHVTANAKVHLYLLSEEDDSPGAVWDQPSTPTICTMPSKAKAGHVVASVVVTKTTHDELVKCHVLTVIHGQASESGMLALESLYNASKIGLAKALEKVKEVGGWRLGLKSFPSLLSNVNYRSPSATFAFSRSIAWARRQSQSADFRRNNTHFLASPYA